MSDRQRVVYKTPLHRFFEISLVVALTFGLALLWHKFLPDVTASYPIIVSLILGFATIPAIGSQWALHCGAPTMTREERTRRYLNELGPIGMGGGRPGMPAYTVARRAGRSRRG